MRPCKYELRVEFYAKEGEPARWLVQHVTEYDFVNLEEWITFLTTDGVRISYKRWDVRSFSVRPLN